MDTITQILVDQKLNLLFLFNDSSSKIKLFLPEFIWEFFKTTLNIPDSNPEVTLVFAPRSLAYLYVNSDILEAATSQHCVPSSNLERNIYTDTSFWFSLTVTEVNSGFVPLMNTRVTFLPKRLFLETLCK